MSATEPAPTFDSIGDRLTDFSPSRLTLAGKCGLAFEYQYVRRLPAPYEGARALFGTAVHKGTQDWYELPDDGYKTQDLAPIVLAQWERLLPPGIWSRVLEIRDLYEECEAVAAAILFKRPQLKSPMTTKEFMESSAAKAYNDKKNAMLELCEALPTIKWPKDEDPWKAYQKSAEIAEWMQRRWQKLPRPLAIERPFALEIEGFRVRGQIDQLRADPLPSGEAWIGVVDIKTGTQVMTPMEAFLQAFLYHEAVRQAEDLPTSDRVAFYLARKDKYQIGKIDYARHRRLASRILNGRARQIAMGQFEPSYGFWCKQCDFNDVCSSEVSLWQGDGLAAELMEIV